MKKFLIAIALVFIINLGCKKLDEGGGLCACSPIKTAYLSLVIKDSIGADLLNATSSNYLSKDQIQLFRKGANEVVIPINFNIRPPFSYSDEKYAYYQLNSYEIGLLAKTENDLFYLKIGDKIYELNLQVKNNRIEKLLIDKQEAMAETGKVSTFIGENIFILTR